MITSGILYLECMSQRIPTGEELNLGNLRAYWGVIEDEFAAIDHLPPLAETRTLSARAFDEAQPAGLRTYMEVSRYLNVARDNHEALLALFRDHGATVWAPWSLMRPIFETSFLASWILDPDDGRERRLRGLRCEVRDALEQRAHRAVFKVFPEVRDAIEAEEQRVNNGSFATYRSEAQALGAPWEKVHQKLNVVDELKRLSIVQDGDGVGPFLEGTWRLLSGYEHGLGWAVMRGSDKTVSAEIPGGAQMLLVINDDEFVNAAKSTYMLLINACRLLRQRHNEPSAHPGV